jgi:hypothetical protein
VSAESGPHLVIPNHLNAPKCRLCDREAALIDRPSGTFTEGYAYCAHCVDAALERFDIGSPS